MVMKLTRKREIMKCFRLGLRTCSLTATYSWLYQSWPIALRLTNYEQVYLVWHVYHIFNPYLTRWLAILFVAYAIHIICKLLLSVNRISYSYKLDTICTIIINENENVRTKVKSGTCSDCTKKMRCI